MLTAFAMALLSALLLVTALLVRLAGRSRVLRMVDYSRVGDIRALHAWAGNRLLLTALVGFALSALAAAQPRMAYFLLAALLLGILSSAIALGTGALKFQA
jgi:hypothetical protein